MAEWDSAYINNLPDSAFAVVLPGGEKDAEGKTVPRDLRKLPHHNAAGDVDMAHLRNAMSRESQSDMPAAMHSRAESHLQAHMEAETRAEPTEAAHTLVLDSEIQVRDLAKREIDMRIVPFNSVIQTVFGTEEFRRGAFAEVDAKKVLLMGLEHEAHFGLGQDGQPVLTRHPVGKGVSLEERDDAAYATFRVAQTQRGDEVLALAAEGIVTGVSVEIKPVTGGTQVETRNGRRHSIHTRVGLPGVSTTYRPAYEQAAVIAVRSKTEGDKPVAEPQTPAPEPTPVPIDVAPLTAAIAQLGETLQTRTSADTEALKIEFKTELDGLKEQMRSQISIPAPQPVAPPPFHAWLQREIYRLTNEPVPGDKATLFRTLDDVTVAENPGAVPTAYLPLFDGELALQTPFLDSTRQLTDPGGTVIQTARITQHTTADVQSTEKSAVSSQALTTTPDTWNMVTIAGAVDVSLQFIRRAPPASVQLLDDDMRAVHAQKAEEKAIDALLAQTGVVEGGTLDAEALSLGDAFVTTWGAMNQGPDTMWLSTKALGKFIDAKATTSNTPLYSRINADINAAGGISGTVAGLRVVHVPQLVDVDVIVGPSRAFGWVREGPIKLSVDNVELAGRDIGYVGFYFFIPRYAPAFTTYGMIAS